jgi:hypothetical protein
MGTTVNDADDADASAPEILDSHDVPGAGGYDVLPALDQAPPTRSRRGRWIALVAGVATVALVAAGGVAVGLSLSGGGSQPEDLVPANAVAYVDVDLDPSAAQKLNAVRFLRHFPSASKALGPSGDVRGLLGQAFDGLPISQGGSLPSWLGQRFGLAVLPGAGGSAQTPVPELVVQVTDANAARTALTRWLPTGASIAVSDGYAVITQSPQSAQHLIDQAHAASLATSPSFTDAMSPLGDGVASFYFDTAAMATLGQQLGPLVGLGASQSTSTGPGGIAAGVVRFQPDAIELVASAPAAAGTAEVPASMVATLPDSSVVAVGASSSAALIKTQTAALVQRLSLLTGLGAGSGLAGLGPAASRLPQDLMALVGDQLAISVDRKGVATDPMVGFMSRTDPQRSRRAVDDVVGLFRRHGTRVVAASTSDTVVLANDPGYAATLAAQDGTLGDDPRFRSAVPDAQGASLVAFVDLSALLSANGGSDPNTAAWDAIGASAHSSNGRTAYLVRLTVKGG